MPKPNSDLTRVYVRSTYLVPAIGGQHPHPIGRLAPLQLDLSRRRKIAELINRQNETDGISLDINVSFRTIAGSYVKSAYTCLWISFLPMMRHEVFRILLMGRNSDVCASTVPPPGLRYDPNMNQIYWFVLSCAAKALYCIVRFNIVGRIAMGIESKRDEIRWEVLKAMLDEFPRLRDKTSKYLRKRTGKRV